MSKQKSMNVQQLSFWQEELAPIPQQDKPIELVEQPIAHHHIKLWFYDYRPEVVYCTAGSSPTFSQDEVWSAQFVGPGCYFEECYLCNPDKGEL
jgi:hypothetical protein